jgi:hypothetical protein
MLSASEIANIGPGCRLFPDNYGLVQVWGSGWPRKLFPRGGFDLDVVFDVGLDWREA